MRWPWQPHEVQQDTSADLRTAVVLARLETVTERFERIAHRIEAALDTEERDTP